jgi:TRAP-type C4-dicarboxylate transport system permease large subunit
MSNKLLTIPFDDLGAVTGGSIIGNILQANGLFGLAGSAVAAVASVGYEQQKHGAALGKYNWGTGITDE